MANVKARSQQKPRLTNRQRRLIQGLAKGMTQAAAAKYARYRARHLRQSGHQALEQIRKKAPELLDEKGLTDEAIFDKLMELLEAQETIFAKFEGEITDAVNVQALDIQLRTAQLLCDLKGLFPEDRKTQPFDIAITVGTPLPEQYIEAISRALGMTGEFKPLPPANPVNEKMNGNGHGAIDVDLLPQE